MADPTVWPSLDQAKVDVSPTVPTKKSPRDGESSPEPIADPNADSLKKKCNFIYFKLNSSI